MKKEKNNIGYKAMNSDMTCRNYQFELGETYEIEEGSELEICENGFHFCFNPIDCLDYYSNINGDRRFFKIQYDEIDMFVDDNKKACTNKITILEEINIIDYIRENKDTVNWHFISSYQKLSEDLIREYKDEVCWYYISIHQKLSEDFIREFEDKVNWDGIYKYQKLSSEFKEEFKHKIN